MEQIFSRAWLFLCHESQIRRPGDFFQAVMGRDNVLVVRQRDGSVRALLNTCAHRGNAVCRAEEGNAKNFLCTYHGWSYSIDGQLQGVPGHRRFYQPDFDKKRYGLQPVAKVASYRGFVFGTHDSTAPELTDFLGATGRLGLDLLASRGDMEVVPGIQKFVVDCNWKFAVDNVFDWYHPQVTHASAYQKGVLRDRRGGGLAGEAIDTTGVQMQSGVDLDVPVSRVTGVSFDQLVVLGEYGHAISGPTADSPGNAELGRSWRERPEAREQLGPVGIEVAGHPGIFPTTWVTTTCQLSLRIPRSPDQTEIWWFTFVDRSAPPEVRRERIRTATRIFGPGGLLEQDDGENWAQSTEQVHGTASRQLPQVLNMGLGQGRIQHEHGLARIEGSTNEHAQLWLYHAWAQWMKGLDWPELRAATTPGESI